MSNSEVIVKYEPFKEIIIMERTQFSNPENLARFASVIAGGKLAGLYWVDGVVFLYFPLPASTTAVAKALIDLNYQIDTSILPFNYWKYSESSFQLASNAIFGLCIDNSLCGHTDNCSYCENPDHCILEIPATTGFIQNSFGIAERIKNFSVANNFTRYTILRVLNKLRIINYCQLSPETSSCSNMIKLTKVITQKGYPFINMHFHSTNLLLGKAPYVKNKKDLKFFLNRIDRYLRFATSKKISFIGMSDALKLIGNRKKN